MTMRSIHHYEQHEILRLVTRDGFVETALLITDKNESRGHMLNAPILLQIHGLLGHFLAHGTPRLLPHALSERGINSLSINTRLANAGQFTSRGIFEDTINDIDAAVEFLEQEGFKNVFILGYSLGAAMLVNWAANRRMESIRGLVFEGLEYSFPDSERKKFAKWGSDPSYEETYRRAGEVLGDDPHTSEDDETFVIYHSRGPDRTPGSSEIFTYKTWWFMGSPKARASMAYTQIHKIKLPILFVRGEADFLVEDWEPDALAEIVRKAGNVDVRVKRIPNARHDCMENPDAMMKELTDMFQKYSVSSIPE